ncbi:unnamed protein product [Bursaphelenchus xylophilus]|uniref:(pine wood nematode) hypothetical protein n=1 Tax=Bursaphelenchus xylophilus TaxID=6326 RepID=A0A1I7S1P9_BURXY|nr:unnamed protein product [Bursaphelenchus xylophilus]CAG9089755.1 unnamed protein product [Bursaphelenchus xylophilus]
MPENCVNYTNRDVFQTVSVLAVVANGLLYRLIRKHTPFVMSGYKKVLYTSCIFDGLAAISHFSILLRPSMEQDVAVANFDGPLPHFIDSMGLLQDGRLAYLMIVEMAFQFNTLVYSFVPFTYRYFHIVRNVRFTNLKFACLCVGYVAPTILLATVHPLLAKETYEHMVLYLGPATGGCLRRIPFYDSRVFYEQPYVLISYWALHGMWFVMLFPLISLFCAFQVYRKLNQDVQRATALKNLQRQITIVLTVQTAVPFVSVALPVAYVIYHLTTQGHSESEKNFALRLFFGSLAVVPLSNATCIILFVKEYRIAVLRGLRLYEDRRLVSTTISSLVASSKVFTTVA